MSLFREKIRRPKAQLEPNLVNDIKTNQKYFYKYMEGFILSMSLCFPLHPISPWILDVGENIVT